ncbi:MAG: hypothetical protein HN576_07670 [Bacteriovoracaceae bacterium]|jgi:hypothetical protein|nr:hypothetical protein [Bacteriovoracaceae bacterium]
MFSKITILFCLVSFSLNLQASELEIFHDKTSLMKFKSEDWKNEKLSSTVKGKFISQPLFNIHRRMQATYEGFSLQEVLDIAFGDKDWRKIKKIRFFAKDGVVKEAKVKEMIAGFKKHKGIIAIRNKGKEDLDLFVKGINTIYPGPFYLVWSGFSKEDYSGGAFKWPYHLSKIILISK